MTTHRKVQIAIGIALIVVIVIAIRYFNRDESAASTQSTDDAYVQADYTQIAPRISGIISAVSIEENQTVRKGQSLVDIDDRDLRVALDGARAKVASAEADIASLQAQIKRQASILKQAHADVAAASADLNLAQANQSRFSNLAADGSGTLQAKQQADTRMQVQSAQLQKSQSNLTAITQQTSVLHAELLRAQAALRQAQAGQAAAELNLSYAHLSAPIDGVVSQNNARVGAYVAPGKALLTIVPINALYIEANFRELQLARMRVGQAVSLTVDALPGTTFHAHVSSLAPATGSSFSPIPAHNATGNFTKIVQRLPIRIRIDPGQEKTDLLRVGMSVHPVVDVTSVQQVKTSSSNPNS